MHVRWNKEGEFRGGKTSMIGKVGKVPVEVQLSTDVLSALQYLLSELKLDLYLSPDDDASEYDGNFYYGELSIDIHLASKRSFGQTLLTAMLSHELTHAVQMVSEGDDYNGIGPTDPWKYVSDDHEIEAHIRQFIRESKGRREPLEKVIRDHWKEFFRGKKEMADKATNLYLQRMHLPRDRRVGSRSIEAGTIEVPKKLLAEVTNWALANWLGDMSLRSELPVDNRRSQIASIRRDLDNISGLVDKLLNDVDFSDMKKAEDTYESFKDISGGFANYTKLPTLSEFRAYGDLDRDIARGKFEIQVREWLQQRLAFLRRSYGVLKGELRDLEEPLRKYLIESTKYGKPKPIKKFEVDGDDFDYPILHGRHFHFEARYQYLTGMNALGVWQPKLWVLAISRGIESRDELLTVVRHELQHMVQSFLAYVLKKSETQGHRSVGVAPRDSRTPEYNENGPEADKKDFTHDLDDAEFHTELEDARVRLRAFMAVKPNMLLGPPIDPHDNSLFRTFVENDKFMRHLRSAPGGTGKYRVALKELAKVWTRKPWEKLSSMVTIKRKTASQFDQSVIKDSDYLDRLASSIADRHLGDVKMGRKVPPVPPTRLSRDISEGLVKFLDTRTRFEKLKRVNPTITHQQWLSTLTDVIEEGIAENSREVQVLLNLVSDNYILGLDKTMFPQIDRVLSEIAKNRGWLPLYRYGFDKKEDEAKGAHDFPDNVYSVTFIRNYDEPIKDPAKLYHLTLWKNLDRILRKGILGNEHTNSGRLYKGRVYLSLSHEVSDYLHEAFRSMNSGGDDPYNDPYALLEIDSSKLLPGTKFYEDPEQTGAVYTYSRIPPSAIVKINGEAPRDWLIDNRKHEG